MFSDRGLALLKVHESFVLSGVVSGSLLYLEISALVVTTDSSFMMDHDESIV